MRFYDRWKSYEMNIPKQIHMWIHHHHPPCNRCSYQNLRSVHEHQRKREIASERASKRTKKKKSDNIYLGKMANQNYWREKKWQRKNATAKHTNCGKTHICMKLKVACTPIQMFWASNRGEQSEWSVCVCSHGYVTLSGSIKFVPYIPGIQSKKEQIMSGAEQLLGMVWMCFILFFFLSLVGVFFSSVSVSVSFFFCLFKPKHIIVADVFGERFYVAAANSRRQKSTRI